MRRAFSRSREIKTGGAAWRIPFAKLDAKTRVFVSYSRKDMAFADRLEAALKA